MRTVNFILPKKWIELDNKQLLFVSRLFLSDFAEQKYKFLTHAFMKFTNLKIKKSLSNGLNHDDYILKGKKEKPFKLNVDQLRSAASSLSFLLDEVTEINPVAKIRNAAPCHYRLYNTPFIQFLTAENFYKAYSNTSKEDHLNKLLATLYLKPGICFNDRLVTENSKYFRRVNMVIKYSVFLWYSGFRWYVSKACPNIFSSGGSGTELDIKDHVMNMIRGLTEGDVTKSKSVQNVDTWEALYELDAKAKHINDINNKAK